MGKAPQTSLPWLESGGNGDVEKGLCGRWAQSRSCPQTSAAERGTRPRETCLHLPPLPQAWLGSLSRVFAPAGSRQPVLGRQPVLLQWLKLGLLPLGSGCYQSVRNVGFWGRIQRSRGAAPLLVEKPRSSGSPGMLREGAVRTGNKFQVNLWKQGCFRVTNTKGWGPSSSYSIFRACSQFQLHPAGWRGVRETLGHARPC